MSTANNYQKLKTNKMKQINARRKLTLKVDVISNLSFMNDNSFDTGMMITSLNRICSIP
jgi:ribosome-binding factor A